MWFWANDSKQRHIIYRWKWFFVMIKNLRFLPKNKASFGWALLSKFWQLVSKSVFKNLATFVANRGYRYDRGIERNLMEPRNIINVHQRRRIEAILPRPFPHASTTSVGGSSVAEKLSSPPTGILWSSSYDVCMETRPKLVNHDGCHELVMEERERYRWEGRQRGKERSSGGEKGSHGEACWSSLTRKDGCSASTAEGKALHRAGGRRARREGEEVSWRPLVTVPFGAFNFFFKIRMLKCLLYPSLKGLKTHICPQITTGFHKRIRA